MRGKIKNILVFTNTLIKGGTEIQIVELVRILQSKYIVYLVVFYGHEISVDLLNKIDTSKVNLIRLSGKSFGNALELYKLIKTYQIDCIYSFLATTNFFSAIIGRFCRVPFLIGGFRSSKYSGLKLKLQKLIHNHFFSVSIVNSICGKDFLINVGFNANKLVLIPNIFVPYTTSKKSTREGHFINIISVARFVPEKDYITAIKAISNLKMALPSFSFQYLIVGYGEIELKLRKEVETLKLTDVIKFLINPNNIPQLLNDSDIFLQTSLFEGTSNAILEAMFAYLPIIATNVGDNPYIIKPENGFLVNVGDFESIVKHLVFLINNPVLRVEMGVKGHKRVIDNFGEETFKQKNFELLDRLQN